jgi:methionyl-tRNA formyltransferase
MAPIGFAATAPLGADVLERLAARHAISFSLTRPDRPAGRGRRLDAPPAKITAERLGIPVLQPERLDESVHLPADVIVTCAYGAIVPPALLDRHLWLNVHPSLLPRWRGAAPVERAIMAGDEETGVTIIKLVEELDAGPIAAQQAFPIGPDDDAGAVYEQAAAVAADLLERVLVEPSFRPQLDEGIAYAEKLTRLTTLRLSSTGIGTARVKASNTTSPVRSTRTFQRSPVIQSCCLSRRGRRTLMLACTSSVGLLTAEVKSLVMRLLKLIRRGFPLWTFRSN